MFDYKKIVKEYEDLKNQNPNIYKNINAVSAAADTALIFL